MKDSRVGCLVVGSPRSGTTLCASMIGAHPDVIMHSEDMRHGAHSALGAEVWGNKLCVPNHIALDPHPDPRSIWRRMEDAVRALLGKPRWHRNWPSSLRRYTIQTYVEQGARVVGMIRDPDHVVDSMRRRGDVSIEKGKERWSNAIRILWQVAREFEERTCLIRFRDLVSNPETDMRNVCNLLHLPYSERMAEGYKYTPQYNRDRIDPSVATRDVRSYDLKEFDPKAFEMYTELIRQTAQEPETCASQ